MKRRACIDPGDLSVRADRASLGASGSPAARKEVLTGEAFEARHRIVDLQGGAPFDAELVWSAGNGLGNTAKLSLARAGRVCVFARTVRVTVVNQGSDANDVNISVGDGYCATRNFKEHLGVGNQLFQSFEVPPFALNVRADVEDAAKRATSTLRLVDAFGNVSTTLTLDQLPPSGLPVGLARSVELQVVGQGALRFRVAFELAL